VARQGSECREMGVITGIGANARVEARVEVEAMAGDRLALGWAPSGCGYSGKVLGRAPC